MLVGLVGLVGLAERRTLMLPAVAVGGVVAAAGGVLTVSSFSAGAVYTVALVLAVVVGSALPWVALGTTRPGSTRRTPTPTSPPSRARCSPARCAGTPGWATRSCSPSPPPSACSSSWSARSPSSLGVTGALVVVCACVVLMLRTRQYRVGSEVAAGLLCGIAGLVALAVSVIVEQPTWHVALALLLAITGAVLLVFTLVPMAPSVRRGRLGDISELVALVAMLPLLVFAIGLVGAVGG